MPSKPLALAVALALSAVGLGACDQMGAQKMTEACDAKIRELDTRLGARVTDTEQKLSKLDLDVLSLQAKAGEHDFAAFTPGSSGYSRVDSMAGTFLVAVKEFKSYANGYRLVMDVGNPSAARYVDARMNIQWGKPWHFDPKGVSYEDWEKSLLTATTTIPELRPATWNRVSVVLSPAQPEDTGHVRISIETSSVFLALPRR